LANFLIKHSDGRIEGPITAPQLRAGIRAGKITESTLIQQEGRRSWHAAGTVRGLASLFAEAAAARAGESAAESGLAAEPNDPPVRAAPAAAASATASARSAASTAAPARPGLGDRILRGAFQFARSISVLVIIASLLVAAGGSALAVYALLPSPPTLAGSPDKPTLAEFVEECSRPSASQQAPRQSRPRGRDLETVDDCGPYRARAEAIVARLKVTEAAVDVLCSRIAAVPAKHRDAFIGGLEALSVAFESNPPKGEDCTGADAANWYMREFFARIELEQAEEAAAEAAAAARRSMLMPALTAIGSAIAALLMFLILPLLIQIERNTRAAS
jgi:hypothetical protein